MITALFAYGTLQLPEVMRAVTRRRFPSQPARLAGYARYLLRGRPYPGLRPQRGAITEGVLYSGLTRAAWRRLDRFEDDGCYRKRVVAVLDEGGRRHKAVVYVTKAACYRQLSRRPWSAEAFRRRGLHAFRVRCGLH